MKHILIGLAVIAGVLIIVANASALGLQEQGTDNNNYNPQVSTSQHYILQTKSISGSINGNLNQTGDSASDSDGFSTSDIRAEADGKQSAGVSNWLLALFSALGLAIILVGYKFAVGYRNR